MADSYFIKRGEKSKGPFSLSQLQEFLKGNQVKSADMISVSAEGPWVRFASVFKEVKQGVAPPLPDPLSEAYTEKGQEDEEEFAEEDHDEEEEFAEEELHSRESFSDRVKQAAKKGQEGFEQAAKKGQEGFEQAAKKGQQSFKQASDNINEIGERDIDISAVLKSLKIFSFSAAVGCGLTVAGSFVLALYTESFEVLLHGLSDAFVLSVASTLLLAIATIVKLLSSIERNSRQQQAFKSMSFKESDTSSG